MAGKKIDRIYPLWQRTDQGLTFTKNPNYTMDSTDGQALTTYLYNEATSDTYTSGTDVTVGSPTGEAQDTTIAIVIDTLTGITLTKPTWFEVVTKAADGTVIIPNAITADKIMILLYPQPS